MERERMKEPDADQISDYEKIMRHYQEWAERQKNGKLLIRGDERDYQVSRQGFIKYYLNPLFTDTAISSWAVFEHLIKRQSGRHKHQGGIIIYVLEGQGITETWRRALEWQAGDLLLLPIQPGGCGPPALEQGRLERLPLGRVPRLADRPLHRQCDRPVVRDAGHARSGAQQAPKGTGARNGRPRSSGEQVPLVTSPDELANVNLFDRLIALRDLQRQRLAQTTFLIRGDELPWELNAHGRMQWYLHPCIAYTAVQTHLFYRQEIPAGSRSGVQRHGGDVLFYILEGEGYTEVDGVRHVWKGGDVMTLPIFPDGVVYRHVNTGTAPVRLICIERNLVHTTGVDRQSGFEELQPCPEYRAGAIGLRVPAVMIDLTVAPSLREYAASSASLVSLDPAVMAEHGLKPGDLLRIATFRREILARVDESNDEDRGSGHIRLDRFQRQALQARLYARVELAPEGERPVRKVRLQPAVDLSTASAHHIEEHLKEELVEQRSPVAEGALMFLHFHHSVAGTLFQVVEVQPGAGVVTDDTDVVLDAAPGGLQGQRRPRGHLRRAGRPRSRDRDGEGTGATAAAVSRASIARSASRRCAG